MADILPPAPKILVPRRLCLVVLGLILLLPHVLLARDWVPPRDPPAHMVYFKSDTCPNCVRQQRFLDQLQQTYPNLRIHTVDVNRETGLWAEYRTRNGVTSPGIPRTVIGDLTFIGFASETGPLEYIGPYQAYFGFQSQLLDAVLDVMNRELSQSGVPGSEGNRAGLLTDSYLGSEATRPLTTRPAYWFAWLAVLGVYGVAYFLLGFPKGRVGGHLWLAGFLGLVVLGGFVSIFLTPPGVIRQASQALPFPLFVAAIALADGFNPCAFTVLAILLSLLTHTKKRSHMVLIGGIFIGASALVYFGFIMIMVLAGSLALERFGPVLLIILGLMILGAGILHLKDFFWFKAGPSLSISQKNQKIIHSRSRAIVQKLQNPGMGRRNLAAALGGTVILALFVNLVELGCTAMLPAVYMATLVSRYSGLPAYVFWTGIYALVYIIPLLVILAGFVYSFSSARLSQTQGRVLKLAAGLFLLFFGLLMILRPELILLA